MWTISISHTHLSNYVDQHMLQLLFVSFMSHWSVVLWLQVTGDTVYNIIRLAEVECDRDERPLNPHKIRSTEVCSVPSWTGFTFSFHWLFSYGVVGFVQVLHSPFDDIVPRQIKVKKEKNKEEGKKSQSKATKYDTLSLFKLYLFIYFIYFDTSIKDNMTQASTVCLTSVKWCIAVILNLFDSNSPCCRTWHLKET